MIGERNFSNPNPTAHVPPPPSLSLEDPTADVYYPEERASQWNLASDDVVYEEEDDEVCLDMSDQFRMFEFKVRKCTRGRSHDWTECPYAHPGEKARRRDPRQYHYSGTACPDFRKGICKKGDACEYGHGVFECWLHPARYRTQPCKDGPACTRRVCFFAHTSDELRILTPRSLNFDDTRTKPFTRRLLLVSPPESISPTSESPPLSPLIASLRQLQLNKMNSMPCSWNYGPPIPMIRPGPGPGFLSLPSTPIESARIGIRPFDLCDEEPVMERVESGRDLRAKMFEKLSRENILDRVETGADVGWISDLLK